MIRSLNLGSSCIRNPNGTLGAIAVRVWAVFTLVALAAGGLVGWFVVVTLPILGLFVFAGLLLGLACAKSMGMIARARSSWSGADRRRGGAAVAERQVVSLPIDGSGPGSR